LENWGKSKNSIARNISLYVTILIIALRFWLKSRLHLVIKMKQCNFGSTRQIRINWYRLHISFALCYDLYSVKTELNFIYNFHMNIIYLLLHYLFSTINFFWIDWNVDIMRKMFVLCSIFDVHYDVINIYINWYFKSKYLLFYRYGWTKDVMYFSFFVICIDENTITCIITYLDRNSFFFFIFIPFIHFASW
jgi:hypothetical protein